MTLLSVVLLVIGFITRCIAGSEKLSLFVYFAVCLASTELISGVLLIVFAEGQNVLIIAAVAIGVNAILNIAYVIVYIYMRCRKNKVEEIYQDEGEENKKEDLD